MDWVGVGHCRTGKRDLHGMINDGLNSLARMYSYVHVPLDLFRPLRSSVSFCSSLSNRSSAFSDFFAQAVISFSLGQLTFFPSRFVYPLLMVHPSISAFLFVQANGPSLSSASLSKHFPSRTLATFFDSRSFVRKPVRSRLLHVVSYLLLVAGC
jgi:hypothetical protein